MTTENSTDKALGSIEKSPQEQKLMAFFKEISLLKEAVHVLEWDSLTGMPKAASSQRGEVMSYLYGQAFEKETGAEMADFLAYFAKNPAELSDLGQAALKKAQEEYELNSKIPAAEMADFLKVTAEANAAWRDAREAKDFSLFQPTLEKIVATLKKFIPLWQKSEKTPYDVLLNRFEPEMTVATLDPVFAKLRTGIMEIRQILAEKGTEPRTFFLNRTVTKEQQRKFATKVVEQFGYDFSRGRLDDTIHPFMLGVNRNDIRITTRWDEQDFTMATFGIIHEAGHGIYEQNIAAEYAYTPLSEGTSMGIHESQSIFHEIILGSNKSFWKKQYPLFQSCTGETFADISFDAFYRGLKHTAASLIRIEADSLTYPLHIIIRYEVEKMLFNGELEVKDLPAVWNAKYQEYLGVTPRNDLEGILQDVHWNDGSFGYFPSYALGFMYAAQLLVAMKREIDVESLLASDDYSPIRRFLTEKIHQYGASRKPNQLILEATGEALNPDYLLEFLRTLYFDVYQVIE